MVSKSNLDGAGRLQIEMHEFIKTLVSHENKLSYNAAKEVWDAFCLFRT